MVGNKDFSQYLAAAKANRGVAAPKSTKSSTPLNLGGGKTDKGFEPLSWLVDILSRPMRATENVPNTILDEELKKKIAKQTGTQYNELGGFVNVLTSPLRGFFSTNPADQPTGAQLIEKQYDVANYGKPGYKDVTDNVNPVEKGAAGLAIDIGMDPLTWIPGTQLVKAGQLGARGIKAGVEAADLAIAGTNFGKAVGAEARVASRAKPIQDFIAASGDAARADLGRTVSSVPSINRSAAAIDTQALQESLAPASKAFSENMATAVAKAKEAVDARTAKTASPFYVSPTSAAKPAQMAAEAPVEAVPSAAILDALGAPKGSTVGEQYAATGAQQAILDQLGLIKPSKSVVSVPKPVVDTFTPQIEGLKAKVAKATQAMSSSSDRVAIKAQKDVARYEREIASLEAQKAAVMAPRKMSVEKSFSSSTTLKNLLADPATETALKETLGDPVVAQLAGIKDAKKLERAVEYLGKTVRGEAIAGGSQAQRDLAQALHQKYDIKVPGTDVPAIQGTSNVGTEFVQEAKVADAVGADLKDLPWLGGYTQAQIDEIIAELPNFIDSKYFLKLEGYSFTTGSGALSTSEIMGMGEHIRPWEFNQMKQYTLLESMVAQEREFIRIHNEDITLNEGPGSLKIAAGKRASILLNSAIKKSELALRWLDTKGVSAWMGIGENRIRLYGHQLLRELNNVDSSALAMAYLNTGTSIPLTNIMDAVVAMYRNPAIKDEEILALLKKPVKGAKNFLNGKTPARYGHIPDPGGKARPKNLLTEANKDSKGYIKGWYVLRTQEEVATKTLEMIKGAAPAIQKTVLHNEEMVGTRIMAEQKDFTPAIAESIMNDIADPETFGKSVRDVANLPSALGTEGKANFVTPDAQAAISKPAVDYWPNDVLHDAQFMAKQVDEYMRSPEALGNVLNKMNVDNALYNFNNAADIVKLRGNIFDGVSKQGTVINDAMYLDSVTEQAFNDILMDGHVSRFKRLFSYRAGKENVIHPYDMTKNAMSHALGSYQSALAKLANDNRGLVAGDTTYIAQAFRDIAAGKKSDKAVEPLRKELEKFVWTVFGDPRDKNAVGIWQRAGATLEDMQVYMKKAKIQHEVDLTNAETKFAQGGYDSLVHAGMEDWRTWAATIDDPARFLMDMHFAGFMLHADKTAAALFVAKSGMISTTAAKGFTKIPDTVNLFEHPLIGHMPKGTYVKDDVLKEVNELEKMIMSDFSPKSAAGQWFNDTYLPVLGIWKKGVTIYRPGHHVRNLFSDASIQWVQEGNRHFAKAANAAIRTLAAHRSYDGVDWGKMISEIGDLSMPTTGTKLFMYGKQEITTDALFEAAMKNGLFSDYSRVEDLFDTTTKGKFSEVVDKIGLKDTPIEKFAGSISEGTAHYSRLAHFTQILMKEGRKGKNWQAAVEAAAKKVRRSHPDGMTLTPFERAYLKPYIPFYSWFKQTAPVILEGIAMNPGRFMVYPKASYNMAVALGVDPQSLQDPFPENEMFPSFITNKLTGPIANIDGNYFTAAPGFAYADVLNQFVSDPKQGALSMLTPFIKVPGELITGTKWDTGVSIKDYSDYIDSQLPGVNYIANFTGTSVTGSVASLLSGQGIDQQYAVSKGNKTLLDQGVSASNWFTGAGVQNISRENYRNLAEIEKRNAAAEEAKRQAGTARNPF